jgi:hypothetical protein
MHKQSPSLTLWDEKRVAEAWWRWCMGERVVEACATQKYI